MADSFRCSLVTPERSVLEADVVYADLPAHDGQLGVMHDRAPLLAEMGIGHLRLELPDGKEQHFLLDGGFAQMLNNQLTLLSEKAIPVEEIDIAEANAELAEAEAYRPDTEQHAKKRDHDMTISRVKILLAEQIKKI